MRFVVPFIGVAERTDGAFERGIGVKCPTQEKLIFVAIDSVDPLHYLRAFKMLGELSEISDSLAQDCIIATKGGSRLKNLSETSVYQKSGTHRQRLLSEAQIKALAFKPSPDMVQQVIKGFAYNLVPLATKEPLGLSNVDSEPSCSTVHMTHHVKASASERPCFLPLVRALESHAHTTGTAIG